MRHALEHDVVKVSSVVSACQGQWPVALDSKLFSDFDLNILYFSVCFMRMPHADTVCQGLVA